MSSTKYKVLLFVLAATSAVMLVLFLYTQLELSNTRHNVQWAHDVVWTFQSDRDLALKAEVSEAVDYLDKLHFPEGKPSPFSGSLSNYVEEQRRRAVRDIVVYLRAKTGKDLGMKPEAWIKEYGKR